MIDKLLKFFRPERPVVDLTEEAFDRWLRAWRPDLQWFLGLDVDVQETLADRGDRYTEDLLVAAGFAVTDPEGTKLGFDAAEGDEEAEAALVARRALDAVTRLTVGRAGTPGQSPSKGPRSPAAPAPLSMAGIGERRQERRERREEAARAAGRIPTLFGREGSSQRKPPEDPPSPPSAAMLDAAADLL